MSIQKALQKTVVIAHENFQSLLEEELRFREMEISEKHENLFILNKLEKPLYFSQTVWNEPQELEISSIGHAATTLRDLAPLWHLHSIGNHRRAQLIQDQLRKISEKKISFPSQKKFPPLASWTLWKKNLILYSRDCSNPFPNGQPSFIEDKTAPSRAYLKLWEWMTLHDLYPKRKSVVLDLGSFPGGWTWVLAKLGCQVISVDQAALPNRFLREYPQVEFLKRDAFRLQPQEIPPLDWLFCDIICEPKKLLELVRYWEASGRVKNFLCTIKFKGKTDFNIVEKFLDIPRSSVVHLWANKHELTWARIAAE